MPLPSKNDRQLLQLATSFVNLRVRDFAELTGRSEDSLRRRLAKLLITRVVPRGKTRGEERNGLGYFYRIPSPSNPFEKVFFPTQRAWDKALEYGFISHEVNANSEKSEGQLDHDLTLTDFHKALHFAFGPKLHWSQLWRNRYTRWGKKTDQYINADAFFYLDLGNSSYPAFFVEVENQKGVQEPMRKMQAYAAFAASGAYPEKFNSEDFRVIFLKPSREMVLNLLAAASEDKTCSTKRFWVTDYAASKGNGCTFLTPKDYQQTFYSLNDFALL